jgi:hypothetical protein
MTFGSKLSRHAGLSQDMEKLGNQLVTKIF